MAQSALPSRGAFSAKLKGAASTFAADAKAAAQLVAKQAERTKLQSVSLPNAFNALGKILFASSRFRDELKNAFGIVDAQVDAIRQLRSQSATQPEARNLAEKARTAARVATEAAQLRVLEGKARNALTDLGRFAFERFGEQAGPAEVVASLTQMKARIAALDAEMARISSRSKGRVVTPKRIAMGSVVAIALIAAFVVSSFFGRDGGVSKKATRSEHIANADIRGQATDVLAESRRIAGESKHATKTIVDNRKETERADAEADRRGRLASAKRDEDEVNQEQQLASAQREALKKDCLRSALHEQKIFDTPVNMLPPTPRLQPAFREISKPVQTLELPWDQIKSVQLLAMESLLYVSGDRFSDHLLLMVPALRKAEYDTEFTTRPNSLAIYQTLDKQFSNNGLVAYEREVRAKTFAPALKKLADASSLVGPYVHTLDAAHLLVSGDPEGSRWLNHGSANWNENVLSFWDYGQRKLLLRNVFLPSFKESGLRITGIAGYKDQVVVVFRIFGDGTNQIPGSRLVLWNKVGFVGALDTSVAIGSKFDRPIAMAIRPLGREVVLLYENAIRAFDLDIVKGPNVKADPIRVFPFDLPCDPIKEGQVAFSPDGRKLLVVHWVKEPKKGKDSGSKSVPEALVFDVASWKRLGSARLAASRVGSATWSPDGDRFAFALDTDVYPTAKCVSVHTASVEHHRNIYCKDAEYVKFIATDKLLTGGLDTKQSTEAQFGSVSAWDLNTGTLLARFSDRKIRTLQAFEDGKRVLVGKDKYVNTAAELSIWDVTGGIPTPFTDEFTEERRARMKYLADDGKIILDPAPPVKKSDYDAIQNGMTYREVKVKLCGAGKFGAEVTNDPANKSRLLLRGTVTYDGVGSDTAQCTFVFEGNPEAQVRGRWETTMKLVKKSEAGLR